MPGPLVTRWPLAFSLYVGLCVWPLWALAQQPARVGHVVALQGQATVQHVASTTAEPLRLQQPVFQGDVVQTGAVSKLKLALLDGTELSLAASSSMTLTKLATTPQASTSSSLVKVTKGIFRAVMPTVTPPSNFEIHTPTAVAAVRGTRWLGEVKPQAQGTAIVVLEGQVAIKQANPRIPGEVVLQPGEGTEVVGQRPPTAPKAWKPARINRLVQATELP